MFPLLYPWEGQEQTETIQILVLCFVNDWLNCLSPWTNQNTMPGKQTSIKPLSILQAPKFWSTVHLSQQAALQSIGWPQATFSDSLSCKAPLAPPSWHGSFSPAVFTSLYKSKPLYLTLERLAALLLRLGTQQLLCPWPYCTSPSPPPDPAVILSYKASPC